MNIAIIFAGGVGTRMNTKDKPKQFLMVHGKPIIVHTIEKFQNHDEIDGIIVVCVEGWIEYMQEMQYRYRLNKIGKIVIFLQESFSVLNRENCPFGGNIH